LGVLDGEFEGEGGDGHERGARADSGCVECTGVLGFYLSDSRCRAPAAVGRGILMEDPH
jgi:hypothetical protein